jgi:probable O-glycosylation ligase (exosortase A-associated)
MAGFIITLWLFGITALTIIQPITAPLVYYLIVWMHPEQQMYGGLPIRWTFLIALTSLIGYVFINKERQPPKNALVFFMFILAFWYLLSAFINNVTSSEFGLATDFIKMILMSWVTASVITTRLRIHALIWILIISIGSVSFRTGLITVIAGGGGNIVGPEFLGHTNEYARYVIYTWPFMLYLARHSAHKYVRFGNGVLATTAVLTLIGTNSRGALVAFGAMCVILWLYGSRKVVSVVLLLTFVGGAYLILPPERLESFTSRAATIENPNETKSFQLRTDSWAFGWDFALKNPYFGGGPGTFEREHGFAAHSNYFEVLGVSGFVGFGVYTIIALLAFAMVFRIQKRTRGIAELAWAHDLAFYTMITLVGYFVGGLTKNHGFNEYYYMLLGIMMGLETAVNRYLTTEAEEKRLRASAAEMEPVPQTA